MRPRAKQLPHAGGNGQSQLRAAAESDMGSRGRHHLNRAGRLRPQAPRPDTLPGKRQRPRPQRSSAAQLAVAPQPHHHPWRVDHHSQAAIGAQRWIAERQQPQMQPGWRAYFHRSGHWNSRQAYHGCQ